MLLMRDVAIAQWPSAGQRHTDSDGDDCILLCQGRVDTTPSLVAPLLVGGIKQQKKTCRPTYAVDTEAQP